MRKRRRIYEPKQTQRPNTDGCCRNNCQGGDKKLVHMPSAEEAADELAAAGADKSSKHIDYPTAQQECE